MVCDFVCSYDPLTFCWLDRKLSPIGGDCRTIGTIYATVFELFLIWCGWSSRQICTSVFILCIRDWIVSHAGSNIDLMLSMLGAVALIMFLLELEFSKENFSWFSVLFLQSFLAKIVSFSCKAICHMLITGSWSWWNTVKPHHNMNHELTDQFAKTG